MDTVIEVDNVERRFGHVQALRHVSLDVHAGEIVSLVGDNGAGKSTLMRIISGADQPGTGEVRIRGHPITTLREAQERGLDTVYQDLALAPHLSVAENMFLGRERLRAGPSRWLRWLDRPAMARASAEAIAELGITTLPDISLPVSQLSGGQRQIVAVARAMMWTRTAILLDEPTAALGPKQVAIVLDAVQAIARQGLAIVIVSHDIPRILDLAQRLVILRRGAVVTDISSTGFTVADVVRRMVEEEGPEASKDSAP